jgi:tetratricopeptide (TPR) repeat protein
LASIYETGDRPGEAVEEYRAALRLNPQYLLARRHLADLLLQLGETDEAKKSYAAIIALQESPYGQVQALEQRVEPEYAYAHYGLARIAMARRRFADAIPELQATLDVLDQYDRLTRPLEQQLASIGEADPEALRQLDNLRAATLYRMSICLLRTGGSRARADDLRRSAEKLAPGVADDVSPEAPPSPAARP